MQHTDDPTATFHIEFNRCLDLVHDDTNVARRFALLFTLDRVATAHYDSLTEEQQLHERTRQQYIENNALQSQINATNKGIIKRVTRFAIFQFAIILILTIVMILT